MEQLTVELERLRDEEQRLIGESQRLRTELRRTRAAECIASKLHEDLFSPRTAADREPAAEDSVLLSRLQEAEAEAKRHAAEAARLRERLATQKALQAEAADLVGSLRGRGDVVQAEDESESIPSAREARLTRESAELRRRVSQLENRIQELRATSQGAQRSSASGIQSPAIDRCETRRLQQLDSVALRLHEELKRRAAESSKPPSAASSPPRRLGGSLAPSQCGTSPSKMSTKSVLLEHQIEAFYSRFLLRRASLGKQLTKAISDASA
jgi:hypothetical protein